MRSDVALLRIQESGEDALTSACLDDDAVAALAAGDVLVAERAAFVRHVGSCRSCRRRVASIARALADPALAREIEAADAVRTGRRLPARVLAFATAAAAVLLLVLLPRRGEGPRSALHRSPPVATPAAGVMAPNGAVVAARWFRWATVAGADLYRVTLFDTEGRVVYETRTADTVVALPDSIILTRARLYRWKVDARIGWDRWSASNWVDFTIRPDSER
jgi:hypothetical protein